MVLPSPVFISAILPSERTMAPMICTSKGRERVALIWGASPHGFVELVGNVDMTPAGDRPSQPRNAPSGAIASAASMAALVSAYKGCTFSGSVDGSKPRSDRKSP